MWIRDSIASVLPFCGAYRDLCIGVLKRTSFYLHEAPYANSFRKAKRSAQSYVERRLNRHGYIATYNHELDSGLWWMLLWNTLGQPIEYQHTMRLLLKLYLKSFSAPRDYIYPEVTARMRRVNESAGLVWSAFRPSDDPMTYGFHIPSQFMLLYVFCEKYFILEASFLCESVREGLRVHAVKDGRYCYEVDGFGSCLFMDDANIPSLLSLPFFSGSYNEETYARTREWILSERNPYYASGRYAAGVGSPHTPKSHVWPMALITAAETFPELASVHDLIWKWPRGFVESFDPNRPSRFTRKWFLWPNAWYVQRAQELQPRLHVRGLYHTGTNAAVQGFARDVSPKYIEDICWKHMPTWIRYVPEKCPKHVTMFRGKQDWIRAMRKQPGAMHSPDWIPNERGFWWFVMDSRHECDPCRWKFKELGDVHDAYYGNATGKQFDFTRLHDSAYATSILVQTTIHRFTVKRVALMSERMSLKLSVSEPNNKRKREHIHKYQKNNSADVIRWILLRSMRSLRSLRGLRGLRSSQSLCSQSRTWCIACTHRSDKRFTPSWTVPVYTRVVY